MGYQQTHHQYSLSLIEHEVNNSVISQRVSDGYINATALCGAAGKYWADFKRLGTTKAFFEALEADMGIPISELIQEVIGGNGPKGTWVHPQVAIHLATWLSPAFAVQVTKWVHEWMTGAHPRFRVLPYHIERHMLNQPGIPQGYFSVLQEMTFLLIAPLEQMGYELPSSMVPDISMGRFLCQHLRSKLGINTDLLPTYTHRFPGGRPSVQAKLYPDEVLHVFRRLIQTEWIPNRAAKYFRERDPVALEFVDRLVLLLPSVQPNPPVMKLQVRSKKTQDGAGAQL